MFSNTWVEVDLNILRNNYRIYKSRLKEGQRVMAVVKADAYGHGDKEVALTIQDEGCADFAVSCLSEAISIRSAGIRGQILILGYTSPRYAEQLLEYDITQSVYSEDYAKALKAAGKKIKCHIALDTGMNRIGFDADDTAYCEKMIRGYAKDFLVTGLFTHLAVADSAGDDDKSFTEGQIRKFTAVADSVADLDIPYIHYMNSAGGIYHNNGATRLSRLGIILYGLKPDYSNILPEGIKPALSWHSQLSMVKQVKKGEDISYGRTYRAEKDMTVGTVPVGYADGYHRALSNKGFVIVKGIKAPIVGRVCMDQLMIDLSEVPDPGFEDEVILLGEGYTADDMAESIGTIGYEIVCDISKRVPRLYRR